MNVKYRNTSKLKHNKTVLMKSFFLSCHVSWVTNVFCLFFERYGKNSTNGTCKIYQEWISF